MFKLSDEDIATICFIVIIILCYFIVKNAFTGYNYALDNDSTPQYIKFEDTSKYFKDDELYMY